MPRTWILLILFTFACNHLLKASGDLVYSRTEPRHHVFSFQPGDGNPASNYMINEISKHFIIDVKKVTYTLLFDEKLEIIREKDDVLRLSVTIGNCRFDGYSTYEGYPLDQVLMPDAADFEIWFNTGTGNEILKFSQVPFNGSGSEILSLAGVFNGMVPLSINCDWKKFNYSDNARSRFDDITKRIYNYLAAKYILDLTLDRARQIEFASPVALPFTWLRVMEVRKAYKMLADGYYDTGFIIGDADHVSYMEKLMRLSSHALRLNTLFHIAVDSLKTTDQEMDQTSVADSLIAVQLKYLDLTTEANHYFTPMLTGLAEVAPNIYSFEEMLAGLEKIYVAPPQPDSSRIFRDNFLQLCFQAYILKADQLISAENYVYAMTLLENARELCSTYNFDCSGHLFQTLSKAKYGLYYSYLSIAGQAFDIGRIQMAERYLKMASDFQKTNSDYITSDLSVQRYYNRLLVKMVEDAKSLLLSGKPEQALDNLSKADEYCSLLHPDDCGDYVYIVRKQAKRAIFKSYIDKAGSLFAEGNITAASTALEQADTFRKSNTAEVIMTREYSELLMKIRQKEYEQLLDYAQDAMQQNDPEGSRVFSKKAMELQSSYGFEKPEILETLVPASAKFEIRQQMDSINGLLWDQQLGLAGNKIREIRDKISKSFLDTDMEIMRHFHRIDSLYTVISCRLNDEKFSILLRDAERDFYSGNLVAGYKLLVQASSIQSLNPTCQFEITHLIKLEQLYQPYSYAGILFDSARLSIKRNEYIAAVQLFQNAWNTCTNDLVRSAVFGQVNLNSFVNEAGDPEFYEAAAVYLKERGMIAEAFSLVKYGFHKGIVIPSYRNILETSGRYFAEADFKEATKENKPSPGKYTGNDKWLQEFSRAYHKRWKNLEAIEKK